MVNCFGVSGAKCTAHAAISFLSNVSYLRSIINIQQEYRFYILNLGDHQGDVQAACPEQFLWEGAMKWTSLISCLAMLAALIGAILFNSDQALASATIRHVVTNGVASGDCSNMNWTNACTMQYALSIAQAGDEIWVKAGTYRPHAIDKDVSFKLKDGVAMYGGFAGTEQISADRRWAVNVTILSGDLMGNDNGAARWDNTTYTDNSYHVVTGENLSNTTVLDGFTIQGGNAEGGSFSQYPQYGGGISMIASSPILSNLVISGNTASLNGNGGGLHLGDVYCKPLLTNVLFIGNQAGGLGGAMNNFEGSPILTNVTMTGNHAGTNGGAIATRMGKMPIRNSIFWGNTAPSSPSISIRFTLLTLTNSDIEGGCPDFAPPTACNDTDLQVDPNFVNPSGPDGIYGTADDNSRLEASSPLINKGDNTVTDPVLPATDLDGRPRIIQEIVDMGAFEFPSTNHPPVSSNQTFHTVLDVKLTDQLTANDADGDKLIFQLAGNSPAGILDLHEDGSFTYVPTAGFLGSVSFQFTVSDQIVDPVGPYTATIQVMQPLHLPFIQK